MNCLNSIRPIERMKSNRSCALHSIRIRLSRWTNDRWSTCWIESRFCRSSTLCPATNKRQVIVLKYLDQLILKASFCLHGVFNGGCARCVSNIFKDKTHTNHFRSFSFVLFQSSFILHVRHLVSHSSSHFTSFVFYFNFFHSFELTQSTIHTTLSLTVLLQFLLRNLMISIHFLFWSHKPGFRLKAHWKSFRFGALQPLLITSFVLSFPPTSIVFTCLNSFRSRMSPYWIIRSFFIHCRHVDRWMSPLVNRTLCRPEQNECDSLIFDLKERHRSS